VKIVLYSHFFAPSIGGVETIVSILAHGLTQLRGPDGNSEFEVVLVTSTPRGNFPDSEMPFRVIREPGAAALWRLMTTVDMVHVAGPALMPVLLALLLRKPIVVEHHGFQTICPTGQLVREPDFQPCPGHFMAGQHSYCLRCSVQPRRMALFRLWLFTFLRRWLCHYVTASITPTASLADQVQLPRVETVYHGIPLPSSQPRSEMHSVPTLVFIGRLVTAKGLRILLDAVEILKRNGRICEVLVIGDGPDRAALENHAHSAGISTQVHFLGRLRDSEIANRLARTDILVAPSLGGEVFGLILVENMFRGMPVVASDLGSYREVLGDAGITFRVGDASDLATKISILFRDPAATERLGAKARERALRLFTIENMVDKHADIYRRVVLQKTRI
jgi:glycogen synthase